MSDISLSHRHIDIPAETSQLKLVRDAVREAAAEVLGSKGHLVVLAVDEALANVILHGGASAGIGLDIDVNDAVKGRCLEIRIVDSGPEYDVSHAPAVNPAERTRHLLRGGMGVGIIRKVMDEIHYERLQGARNELRLIKYAARG